MKSKTILAAVAVAFVSMAQGANALTLRVSDSSNPVVDFLEIVDGGAGDLDGVENGSIFSGLISVGSGSVSISTAFMLDGSPTSTLQLAVTNAIAGAADLWIDVWHSGFSGAANTSLPSVAEFVMNASDLSIGGELLGRARVDSVFTGAKDSITSEGASIIQTASSVLSDPFTMRINTDVVAGTTANYDATLTATAVPLPASALLLLGGIGGMAALRRRKKT